jgi:hypothetical protein
MRRIIQIADNSALCDDGTVWYILSGEWYKWPDIPQDDKRKESKITFEKISQERNNT